MKRETGKGKRCVFCFCKFVCVCVCVCGVRKVKTATMSKEDPRRESRFSLYVSRQQTSKTKNEEKRETRTNQNNTKEKMRHERGRRESVKRQKRDFFAMLIV